MVCALFLPLGRTRQTASLTKSTDNPALVPIDEPIGCGYDWCIDQGALMTDPKKLEAQSEELDP